MGCVIKKKSKMIDDVRTFFKENYYIFLEEINDSLNKDLTKNELNSLIKTIKEELEKDKFKKVLKSNYYLLNLLLSYELGYIKISEKYLGNFNLLSIDNSFTFYYFLKNILNISGGNHKEKLNDLLEKLHPDINLNYLLKCFNFGLKEFRKKYIIKSKDYIISTKSYFSNFNETEFFKDITWDFDKDFKMLIEKGYTNNKILYHPDISSNYYLNYLTILLMRVNIYLEQPEFDVNMLLEIVNARSFYHLDFKSKGTILFMDDKKVEIPFGEINESIEYLSKVKKISGALFEPDKLVKDDYEEVFYMTNNRNQKIIFPPELCFKIIKPENRFPLNYFVINEV